MAGELSAEVCSLGTNSSRPHVATEPWEWWLVGVTIPKWPQISGLWIIIIYPVYIYIFIHTEVGVPYFQSNPGVFSMTIFVDQISHDLGMIKTPFGKLRNGRMPRWWDSWWLNICFPSTETMRYVYFLLFSCNTYILIFASKAHPPIDSKYWNFQW